MEETAASNESALYLVKFRRSCRNRESYDAITELVAELRRAYMVKGLEAQLDEKQAHRYAELVRKREIADLIRQEQQEVLEEDLRCRSEILRKSEEYRRQLDEQLTRKVEEKRVVVEEAREYRKFLEEVDRAQEEEERSKVLEKKCALVEKTRQERLILEEMREIHRQEERRAEEKKRLQDLEYLKEIEERSKEVSKLRQEQIERRERVLLETTRIILDAQARKREREERLIDLVAEEIRCELVIKEMEESMRRKKMQQELAATLREQIVFTEQCRLHFVEEDRAWAEEVMRKIMEDEKMARCTAEAKRRMKVQYRKDLESLIEHRRRIREKEIARIEEIAKEQQRLELLEVERAREERRRLLTIHAANIANFVNRATLTAEEREILDELTKKNRDPENIDDGNAKD
ncbi:PREDICTED: meiosis-specific nuclear structural protein 1-like [Vollenhovia emeryi]|uniref:meiosis-specific nuclear structural protein 1-like n=1 Tax=Vollenhovia emeryi TaxID=411798 RepID=UPI0005F41D39|nr:PREDICTED: meiosis-specific nuclear structural protein 1-like [Vollenhovia emeryi]